MSESAEIQVRCLPMTVSAGSTVLEPGRTLSYRPDVPEVPQIPTSRQGLLDLVRHRIRLAGMNQRQLAKRVGMSPNWLSGWFTRKSNISVKHIELISVELGLTTEEHQALVLEFHPEATGDPLKAKVEQQRSGVVWIVAPHFRLADDQDFLELVADNITAGTKYVFCSAKAASLLYSADALGASLERRRQEVAEGSGTQESSNQWGEATFVLGPRWLNLSAWRIINPHKLNREVAQLPIDDVELRFRAGEEGLPVHGALADEVCDVLVALARLDKPALEDEPFEVLRVVPRDTTPS